MLFKKELIIKILNGSKTMTSKDKKLNRPGDVTNLMANKDYSKITGKYIKITSVYPKLLSSFTDEDAKKEGFDNLEHLKQYWNKEIDCWSPDCKVTVHEFEVVTIEGNLDFSNHNCEQCGSCCIQLEGFSPTQKDIKRWVKQQRTDILQYGFSWDEDCSFLPEEEKSILEFLTSNDMDMWFNPETSKESPLCPFLKVKDERKFVCLIQDTKPTICKQYKCKPSKMLGIIKKTFNENLKEYKMDRAKYPSVEDSPNKRFEYPC